ncbi:MAG: hypothetical protein PHH26_03605 [Candidatus Thermoplasmatota archaeon]|nr:hypothetical protein [Candidatus Thermoplasmatota archaeon]
MNVGAILAALLFLGATFAGGFGIQGQISEADESQLSDVSGNENQADECAAESPAGQIFTTVVDEGDVVIRAYFINPVTVSVETEKQHDGKWYVYPFRGASEIIVDLSYEPSPVCLELGLLRLEPQSANGNSKRYVVEVDPSDWGAPQVFMIVPGSFEGSGIAANVNYHIKIQCDGIPPLAPATKQTIVFEDDIPVAIPVDVAEIVIGPLPMLKTFYKFNVPQNAVRVDINCSWSNEYQGLMFTITDGIGDQAAFRGNGGIVGTQSPSPLNTIVNTVKHSGEWEILMHNHVNVACHYKIEITIYY